MARFFIDISRANRLPGSGLKPASDFDFKPLAQSTQLKRQVLETRDECIAESNLMYEQGMYAPFLMQYGEDCKNLPAEAVQKIADAKHRLRTNS
jgi:hypothetical protein